MASGDPVNALAVQEVLDALVNIKSVISDLWVERAELLEENERLNRKLTTKHTTLSTKQDRLTLCTAIKRWYGNKNFMFLDEDGEQVDSNVSLYINLVNDIHEKCPGAVSHEGETNYTGVKVDDIELFKEYMRHYGCKLVCRKKMTFGKL